ncbi:hypothetical protein [Mesorhizobium sp.]|uniref:hypothetical protein n=1 Tax=Mesorhizobium sp. TaxID=1871066 RepID=UPI002579AEE9|nr:hypothetical protein [Mesorhizobium sp.]
MSALRCAASTLGRPGRSTWNIATVTTNCASATSVSMASPAKWLASATFAANCSRISPASTPASTSATSCGQNRRSSVKLKLIGLMMSANMRFSHDATRPNSF